MNSSPALYARLTATAVLAFAGGPAFSAGEPVIDCTPNSVAQLNTGQTAPGNLAIDKFWKLKSLPAYAGADPANWGTFGDATIVTNKTGAWTSTPGNSGAAKWLGIDSYGNQPYFDGANFGNVDAMFQVQFSIAPSVNVSQFQPSMSFSVDNSVWDIFVNGKSQLARGAGTWGLHQSGGSNAFNYNGFGSGRWMTILMQSPDWQAGVNTLTVYVKSSRWQMGFGAAMAGANACAANAVPTAAPVLSGPVTVGQTAVGTYAYADVDSDPENVSATGTSYTIVRAAAAGLTQSAQGTVVQSGATSGAAATVAYPVASADVGQYLYYCVIPAASTGSSPGVEACSAAAGPVVPPTAPISATPVPVFNSIGLLLASAALGGLGALRSRRKKKHEH